jgi:RNA 3'-terminal phosphate cyclase
VSVRDENLVGVVGVRGLSREVVAEDLEDVLDAGGVVDVYVGDELVTLAEEGELKVAEVVVGLEAVGRLEAGAVGRPSATIAPKGVACRSR